MLWWNKQTVMELFMKTNATAKTIHACQGVVTLFFRLMEAAVAHVIADMIQSSFS